MTGHCQDQYSVCEMFKSKVNLLNQEFSLRRPLGGFKVKGNALLS